MKSLGYALDANHRLVAPFTGAWIEIRKVGGFHCECAVAPFTGAWIEMPMKS